MAVVHEDSSILLTNRFAICGFSLHTPSFRISADGCDSIGGGDFRNDLGSGAGPIGGSTKAPQSAGELVALASAHTGAEQQIVVPDAHDLAGTHDTTVQTRLFDSLHGFIIH